jgi:beta-lactamase class A
VAAVLKRVDTGAESLQRRIVFGSDDVLAYAPITSRRVGGDGMSVAALCEAAITVSVGGDNEIERRLSVDGGRAKLQPRHCQ